MEIILSISLTSITLLSISLSISKECWPVIAGSRLASNSVVRQQRVFNKPPVSPRGRREGNPEGRGNGRGHGSFPDAK